MLTAHFYTGSPVCALRETKTTPEPSRFGRCCVTALRTRTCSSCACGYLGKIEIKKQVALYFLISIAMFPKEELNIKMLSHSVAHNRVDRCKKIITTSKLVVCSDPRRVNTC